MIRALREPAFSQAHGLLARMAGGEHRALSVKINGRDGLYRAKDGTSRVRVAWAYDGDGDVPVVDSVVFRSDTTYSSGGDLLRGTFGGVAATDLDVLDEEPRDDDPATTFESQTADHPAFSFDGGDGAAFKRYVYRDFARSPRLTAAQEQDFNALFARPDSDVLVVQGGAGSGKSTFALLSACRDRVVRRRRPPLRLVPFAPGPRRPVRDVPRGPSGLRRPPPARRGHDRRGLAPRPRSHGPASLAGRRARRPLPRRRTRPAVRTEGGTRGRRPRRCPPDGGLRARWCPVQRCRSSPLRRPPRRAPGHSRDLLARRAG